MAQGDLAPIKARTFDVFGTVVDWRGSIIRQGIALGAERGITIDWARFAADWRSGYSAELAKHYKPAPAFTMQAVDFNDLAAQLGV